MTASSAMARFKTIPRLKTFSPFGNYLEYRKNQLTFFARVAREYGDIAQFRIGPFQVVQINSPELVQSFLIEHAHDYDKGEVQRRIFRPLVGNGLLNSEGKFHTQQRKLMASAFQPRRLSQYAATMVDYANQAQTSWSEGELLSLDQEMLHLAMAVVSKVLLDYEIGEDSHQLGVALDLAIKWAKYSTTGLFPLPMFIPTPRSLQTQKAIRLVKRKIEQVIKERRLNLNNKSDLLSTLIQTQAAELTEGGMSDIQLRDEILTIFAAGHETTARALTWSFYLLARNPEVYTKLQAELEKVLAGRPPTYADLPDLPYTLQILKEALRLYPPSSIILRAALKDTELQGYFIGKGTQVMFSQYLLHRRVDYFPNPEQFDPNRFNLEKEQQIPRYAYLPFGAGHRICIGSHFALLEGHLLLATLAQSIRFELISNQPVEPELAVTLRPASEIKVKVIKQPIARNHEKTIIV